MVLVAVGLVAGPALAGCLEDGGGGSAASDGESASGGSGDDLGTTEIRETVQGSLPISSSGEETESDMPERFGIEGSFENDSTSMAFGMLLNKPRDLMVFSMEMTGSEGFTSTSSRAENGTLVIGQHGKVTVMGVGNETGTPLAGWYNESAEPVDELSSPDGPGESGDGPSFFQGADPVSIVENVTDEVEGGESDWSGSRTTHEGKPAVRATITKTKEGVTTNLTAIVWTGSGHLALLKGSIEAQDPADLEEGLSEGTFRFDFSYGDDAETEYTREVVRAASLVFKDKESISAFGSSGNKSETYTIKPTPADGVVALEDAVAVASPSGGFGSSEGGDEGLELPLEDGSASNEKVRLSFVDADDDGLVSPGDEITLTVLGDGDTSSYSLALEDEVTGVRVSPGASVVAVLALVGGLAALRRRPM